MDDIEVARLRRSFRAIRDGFSLAEVRGEKIYIRHLSSLERAEIDAEQVTFFDFAVKKGLLSEKMQLERLHQEGIWTHENQKQITDQQAFIKNLNHTKANVLPWQLAAINEQITTATKSLEEKLAARESCLGMTAEEFGKRKLNELYICYSLFKDKTFDEPTVSREEMEDLDDNELAEYVSIYNKAMGEVSETFVKKIAIARFFQDLYGLCEQDAYRFFGKAVADLTYYQCDLMIYARFFSTILNEETKPPTEIADDPDKIIEWYQSVKNAKKELEKNVKALGDGNGVQTAQSLMGATAEDYKKMGMETGGKGPSLASLAAKSKDGKLNREQMMQFLHGSKV